MTAELSLDLRARARVPALRLAMTLGLVCAAFGAATAQKAPDMGYIFPPGGRAGTTVDVLLGGYDWTPDMQVFAHDPHIHLQIVGPPGEIIVPPPPYWFGPKSFDPAPPLARETPARLVIDADCPKGPVRWQAANANGATATGVFIVSHGAELLESHRHNNPQTIERLPVTVSGRLERIEEVDRYRFTADQSGPVTCSLIGRRIGSAFFGVIEVHDAAGRKIADAVDTEGRDPELTFAVEKGREFVVSIRDVDYRGDPSYVYRLEMTPGVRVLAAPPDVHSGTAPQPLDCPGEVTGRFARRDEEHAYACRWKKGQLWKIEFAARQIGSTIDPILSIRDESGKDLAHAGDPPTGTDCSLEFSVPADGAYTLAVSEVAGRGGSPIAFYRLAVAPAERDFRLETKTQRLAIPLGEKAELTVSAVRRGGFRGPIQFSVTGLPAGVTAEGDLVIPPDKSEAKLRLVAAADAAASASVAEIRGTAQVGDRTIIRSALAPAAGNLAPRSASDREIDRLLIATTLKPVCKVEPVDKDGGRLAHRGATFPAEIKIERFNGFDGPITLTMASQQQRHRQGITAAAVVVPPEADRAVFGCFMPEWLETSRTSRMAVIGLAQVKDPKGNVRTSVADVSGQITMTIEGSLLKITPGARELTARTGHPFSIDLKIQRSAALPEPARIELHVDDELAGMLKADPVTVAAEQSAFTLHVVPVGKAHLQGRHEIGIRATVMQDDRWPVISQTSVPVDFVELR